MSRAYANRAQSELSSLAKAVNAYHVINERYPVDVSRGVPAEIIKLINGSDHNWPQGPWPGSTYDYDYFIGSDGEEAAQMSIRFCPTGGPLSACNFPNQDWSKNFGVNSSAYWCITGKCRAHPTEPDSYPAYCLNCKE